MKRCVMLVLIANYSNCSFTTKKTSTPPMQRKETHNNKQKEKKIADFNTPETPLKEIITVQKPEVVNSRQERKKPCFPHYFPPTTDQKRKALTENILFY